MVQLTTAQLIAIMGVVVAAVALLHNWSRDSNKDLSEIWTEVRLHGNQISELKARIGLYWDIMSRNAAMILHQPTHSRMDELLGRANILSLDEMRELRGELEQRLREPEPRSGYYMALVLFIGGLAGEISSIEGAMARVTEKSREAEVAR